MSEPAKITDSKPKRRIKSIAPPKLQAEVERSAKIVRKHAEVLGPLGMQAIQIATLQVVASKLEDLRRLMVANGVQGLALLPAVAGLPPSAPPPPPKVLNPCVMCGRPGSYQMRFGAHGWYCAGEHANWARAEDGDEVRSRAVSPSSSQPQPQVPVQLQVPPPAPSINNTGGSPPPPNSAPPGLANALRMLQGDEQ